MKINKKLYALAAITLTMSAVTAFAACGKKDNGGDNTPTEPTALAAPVVTLSGNVVSWETVEHAVKYSVYVCDVKTDDVQTTSYTVNETEVGTYPIYVVAVPSLTEPYTQSANSNTVVYEVLSDDGDEEETPELKSLALVSNCTKTEYFLDETVVGGTLDLTGLAVNAVYSNGMRKNVTPVLDGTVDLTSEGDKTVKVSYTEDETTVSTTFVVTVRERKESDISSTDLTVITNEFSGEGNYELCDGEATAVDMRGNAVTVTSDGGKSKIKFEKSGYKLLKVTSGEQTKFVKIIAATYIYTESDFVTKLVEDVSGYYILQNDIVMEGYKATIGTAPTNYNSSGDVVFDKDGYTSWDYSDDNKVGSGEGIAFNGTFDGNGYTISGYKHGCEQTWQATAYYHGLFGYIGSNGIVKNFSFRSATIEGGQACGLIAGVNLGRIENIVIEDDCLLKVNYGVGGYVAGYNDGTIANVVCYRDKLVQSSNSTSVAFVGAAAQSGDCGTTKNVYHNDETDLTEELGNGWFYDEAVGTIYGNDKYKRVNSVPDIMYESDDESVTASIVVYQKDVKGISFITWVNGSAVEDLVKYKAYDAQTYTYSVCLTLSELESGDTFTLGIKSDDTGLFIKTVTVTVGDPYVVSTTYSGGDITAIVGTDLVLNTVNINAKYSDGTTNAIHPTRVEGYDKNGTVDTPQAVKFYYGTGSDDYVTINVTPIEAVGDVAQSITVTKKSGVDKITYSKSKAFDIFEFFDISVTYSQSGQTAITSADSSKLTVSTISSGVNDITVSFTDGASVSTTVNDVEIWYEIADVADWLAINDNLAGYYTLGGDLDLSGASSILSIGVLPLHITDDGTSFDLTDKTSTGKPFTGKFDGNGHNITGFATTWAVGTGWNDYYFGGALFNYVGESGEVKNFTLKNAQAQAPNYTAFIASCNQGLIENVTVEGGSIYANWSDCGAIVCYNYGTVKNCSSDVTDFSNSGGVSGDTLPLVKHDNGTVENDD